MLIHNGESPCLTSGRATAWRLVERARDGDADAFGELYGRYAAAVLAFVASRVNDHRLAEDLTSETFLRALKSIHAFTDRGRDIGAWFMTIARNLIRDHVKSGRVRYETLIHSPVDTSDPAPSAEAEFLARADRADWHALVDRLEGDQRRCVLLRFHDGLSVRDTAAALERTESSTKALQRRATRRLAILAAA